MKTKKLLLSLVLLFNICISKAYAFPKNQQGNFALIQRTDENVTVINQTFSEIVPDIHYLIYRSYKSTKRDNDKKYINNQMLERDEDVTIFSNGHHWHCLKNFQGEQGNFVSTNIGWRIFKWTIQLFTGGDLPREIDYPGFVAYSIDADPTNSIIWVAIILRGSQGEDFQPANGMFGASWLTNYSAGAASLQKDFYPFAGYTHSGYLNKILACEISMKNSINVALTEIGQKNFHKVRFIITGHSQGGGLAQIALPKIISSYGYIYSGENVFNNVITPRFFGYFMSTPKVLSGKDTANEYIKYVGEDNIIRHQAYGDIVPMLCLPGYFSVGHLAIDTFYDTICRAIRSETAYCNRYMLFWAIKDLFDPSNFIIDEQKNTWISGADPNFEINWTELCKVVCSQNILKTLSKETLFKSFLKSAFRQAHPVRMFEDAKELPDVSNQFLFGLLKEKYDLLYVEKILRYFAFFENIKLEEKKKEYVFQVGDTFEYYFGNKERSGLVNSVENFTTLNAASKTLNSLHGFEKFTNKDLDRIVPKDGIICDDSISPAGDTSVIAYLHYGSASNYYKSKFFDSNIPSKNLNLALRNGTELMRTKDNKKEKCVFWYEEKLPKILTQLMNVQ